MTIAVDLGRKATKQTNKQNRIFLSFRLANGSLSPRTIHYEIKKYEKERTENQSTYWVTFELIWRDYFRFVALKYGNKLFQVSGIQDKDIPWKQDKGMFEAWKGNLNFAYCFVTC